MRVFLSTDTVGGVWDYTLTLVRELCARGHPVFLAVVGRLPDEHLADVPPGVEVASRDFRLEWMPGAAGDITPAGKWLSSLATRWRADVAHLNQMAYAVHDFGAPTLVVLHSDVLSWFGETLGIEAPPEWDDYAGWVRAGIDAADVVVAISAYQSALTRRHYGRAADRVIHNGARPPRGEPVPRTAPLVLSAGRAWDEAKGMIVLDRALAALGDKAPAAHLLGELMGPMGQSFHAQRLVCHGRTDRSEVDAWMRRASIYVGASLYEPFGLAPLEAALHGCALVMSDIPIFRELWEGCAEFFPRGDARALASVLAELAPDLDRCAQLAAAARERALSRYTAERFTSRYVELYEQLASSG